MSWWENPSTNKGGCNLQRLRTQKVPWSRLTRIVDLIVQYSAHIVVWQCCLTKVYHYGAASWQPVWSAEPEELDEVVDRIFQIPESQPSPKSCRSTGGGAAHIVDSGIHSHGIEHTCHTGWWLGYRWGCRGNIAILEHDRHVQFDGDGHVDDIESQENPHPHLIVPPREDDCMLGGSLGEHVLPNAIWTVVWAPWYDLQWLREGQHQRASESPGKCGGRSGGFCWSRTCYPYTIWKSTGDEYPKTETAQPTE